MATTSEHAGRFAWVGDVTRYQWMVFLVVWLG